MEMSKSFVIEQNFSEINSVLGTASHQNCSHVKLLFVLWGWERGAIKPLSLCRGRGRFDALTLGQGILGLEEQME